MNTCKDNNLIFDVGLHRGEDAEFYLKKGFRVVAFEANPELVAECEQQFRSFIAQGQLKIIQGAIAEPQAFKAGQRKIAFYRNETGSFWGTICPSWAKRNAKSGNPSQDCSVPSFPVDGCLRLEVLRLYRYIRAGYFLLGDDGILNRQFRGAGRLRALTRKVLGRLTRAAVPGWYDTHARLSSEGL